MLKSPNLRWFKIVAIALLLINILFTGQVGIAAETQKQTIDVIQQEDKNNKQDENLVKFILFITIDGLSEDAISKGYAPNINGLAGSGIKTKAISVFPADTASAMASIFTGANPAVHNFTKPGSVSKIMSLPDLIADKKQSAVIIDGKNGISKGLSPKVKLLTNNKGDKSTTDLAIKEFENKKPYFMQVILSDIDRNIEKYGNGSKEHYASVGEADKQVGRILAKLHEYGLFQYSIIVISGTHGTTNIKSEKNFQNNNEVLVPLYIKGPTIEAGVTIPVAELTNITPTVAYILGMKLANQDSQILWDILKNEGGSSEAYLLKKRVKDLADSLIATTSREYALEHNKLKVNQEKHILENEKGKVQKIIDAKNKEIKNRNFTINSYKLVGIIALILFTLGYIFEYSLLKKKFLMFK